MIELKEYLEQTNTVLLTREAYDELVRRANIAQTDKLPELELKTRLYACDPAKNEACPKDACFLEGGSCKHTTKPECRKKQKKLTKYELIWWVNHLFNIAKEQAFNAIQIEDALEIQEAQFEVIKILRDTTQKAEEEGQ